MAYRAYINGQPGLAINDPNFASWAQTVGYAQDNGQPLPMAELLKQVAVYDDATGQVLHPAEQTAWQDYKDVSGALAGAPAVPGLSGWSYVPMDAYQAGVGEADERAGSILTNGPLQLFGAALGGAALSGLGAGAGAGVDAAISSAFPATSGIGTSGLLGMTGGELGAISGAFPATSGAGGFGASGLFSGAGAAGALGEAGSGLGGSMDFFDPSYWGSEYTNPFTDLGSGYTGSMDPNSLSGGFQTVNAPTNFGAPFQPGYNFLDPSTYGGSAAQSLTQQLTQKIGEQGAKSLVSRLLSGEGSAADYASILGTLGQAGLNIASGLQQSNATNQLGNRILNMGAPSLARYEASFQPGWSIWDQPGNRESLDSSWDSALRNLSATGGNPFGNQGGLIEANKRIMGSLGAPLTQNYREVNRAAGFGNVPQYAQIAQNAIGQQGTAYQAGAAGLEDLLNPRQPKLNLGDLGKLLNLA